MIILESLKAFAAIEPQQEKISDEYTLDEISFKRLFRQIFNFAEKYKDVPRGECTGDNEEYWVSMAREISALSDGWKLHDAEGREIIDQATGCCKYHPLFTNMFMAVMQSSEDIWKARRVK